jgi:hypothetical protein
MHELVARDYCFAFRVGHVDFYQRHERGERCALACFPLPPSQIDYLGKPMDVRAPTVIDAQTSPVLPSGSKEKIVMTACSAPEASPTQARP